MTAMPRERQAEVSQAPPAHLAGALQAAAAARALAARIRSGAPSRRPAPEQPSAATPGTAGAEPQAQQPSEDRPAQPRFAKTIEAAKLMGPSTSQDQELEPWHLSLREEVDARSWPKRWMARVFKPRATARERGGMQRLVAGAETRDRRAAARERGVMPPPSAADAWGPAAPVIPTGGSATVAAVEPPPRGAASGGAPAGIERAPARDRAALVARPRLQPFALGPKEGPGPDRAARWPGLLPGNGLSRRLLGGTGPGTKRWRRASASVISLCRSSAIAGAPGHRGLTTGRAARSLVALVAPRAVPAGAAVVAETAAPAGMARLPVVAPSCSMVRWSSGGLARFNPGPDMATPESSAAPARPADPARARATMRLLLISCGTFAGFALGIVTSGGALITGFNLGQVFVQLDQPLLPGSADAPATGRASDDSQPVQLARGVSSGKAPPVEVHAAGALAGARPSQADLAAGARGSEDVRQAQAATHPAASANPGSGEPTTGAPAPSEPSWAVLYARGHRAQSEGDLVAATHWYREAARLNPRHPAILYDLGYILQVQDDLDEAINHYRQVLVLNPNHAYARYDLGFLLQKKGDNEGAVS